MEEWLEKAHHLRQAQDPFVLVTVTRTEGSAPRGAGAKMIVRDDGRVWGSIGGGHLEQKAVSEAQECLKTSRHKHSRYLLGPSLGQCCGGVVEVFMEVVNAHPRLYIAGAGHVGSSLCRVLESTPFEIHLMDERVEWIHSSALSPQVTRHHGTWEEVSGEILWDERRTYLLVMTHSHDLDEQIVKDALGRSFAYLGLIGSQTKWRRFRDRLLTRGVAEAELSRIRCPVGLDIGGQMPQEIAISIAAELLKIHYAR